MQSEYKTLIDNNTWTLVRKPLSTKIIKNKWVFKVKRDQDGRVEKYKARLVARGDQQRLGVNYEEVYAPVARLETIRTLLAVSVIEGMHVHHMDVVSHTFKGT